VVGGGLARSAGSHWFAVGPYYKRLQSALVNVSSSLHERRRISLARRRSRRSRYYYIHATPLYRVVYIPREGRTTRYVRIRTFTYREREREREKELTVYRRKEG